MDYRQQIKEGAQKWGVDLNSSQLNQFEEYMSLLKKWNQKINLTTIEQEGEIVSKHFLDSLSLLSIYDFKGTKRVIDLGSGAGFPGVPIKIARPELKFTLLDAVNKKITFLRQLIFKLELSSIEAVHGRAEDYGSRKKYREQYNYGLARAVANLSILVEYGLPFIKPGGEFIAYKGETTDSEIKNSQQAIKKLGGKLKAQKQVAIPGVQEKTSLVIIEKTASTASKYPRRPGKPSKQPL